MSKEKLLEALFNEWTTKDDDSQEYKTALITGNRDDIIDCVIVESKQAFTAGFNAAVSLLMGGAK